MKQAILNICYTMLFFVGTLIAFTFIGGGPDWITSTEPNPTLSRLIAVAAPVAFGAYLFMRRT